jgi:glycine oxidase
MLRGTSLAGETLVTLRSARVVLVGGGLVGALSALRLADAGADVLVLEKTHPGAEASSAAAGILAAQAEATGPSPLFELTFESLQMHAALAEEIRGRTGVDAGFERRGILEVARTESEARALLAKVVWQRERALPVDILDAKALRQREPALAAGFVQGVLFPDDASLDPARLTAGVVQAAARAGVRFRSGVMVRRVLITHNRATGVDTDDGVVEGDAVVLCAGAWSGLIAHGLGDPGSVRPARGQLVEFDTCPTPVRSVVYAHGGYVVPRGDGRVVVGSTLEFVGFRRGVTAEGLAKLLATAMKTVPSLGEATVLRTWSNFRPYTEDKTPIVGMRGVDGLVLATGHHRSGILLAPVTAEIVRDLVMRGQTRRAIASLSPLRAIAPT